LADYEDGVAGWGVGDVVMGDEGWWSGGVVYVHKSSRREKGWMRKAVVARVGLGMFG
jgi:hypothetical protein